MRIFFISIILLGTSALAQVIPQPSHAEFGKGFYCGKTTSILLDDNTIDAITKATYSPDDEAYILDVTDSGIKITAESPIGRLRATQTLAQLTDAKGNVRHCHIKDHPAYAWRGAMIDVSRHFFTIDFLKKQIDVLARYKINRLHLHLTDAAGWRIEILRYPRLTKLGAFRTFNSWKTWWNGRPEYGGSSDPLRRKYVPAGSEGACGGYYTQQELRDLVLYAARRGITIIPEIEMPAHSEEVLTAYPELSCTHEPYKQADFCPGNVASYDFLEHVLEEVISIFPSHYIHIGGDEAAKASWRTCPLCAKKMQELGISDVDKLQSHFIAHFGRFLNKHGRQLIGWDEIIDSNLTPNTNIMVWRNADIATNAVNCGYNVILSPGSHCYFDTYQDAPPSQPEAGGGFTTLEKVYSFIPGEKLSQNERKKHITGIQGNLWTEYVPTPDIAEYMLYPRMLAIAEIGWNGTETKNYPDFRQRALKEVVLLRSMGVNCFDLSSEVGDRAESRSEVKHLARGCRVSYAPEAPYYKKAYSAAGDVTLTDGKRGGWNNNDGHWQGFISGREMRFDVTIDLGSSKAFSSVSTDFMQMCGPEIFYPEDYIVSISNDGSHFTELGRMHRDSMKTLNTEVTTFCVKKKARARFIRVQATPSAFSGWLFADEIVVK